MKTNWEKAIAVIAVASLITFLVIIWLGSGAEGAESTPCLGLTPTIIGTDGNDTLIGTAGDDIIAGLAGHDVIIGRGGNDVLCGGPGRDRIRGGRGNDALYGQRGFDKLIGDSGYDRAFGGTDRNRCVAEEEYSCDQIRSPKILDTEIHYGGPSPYMVVVVVAYPNDRDDTYITVTGNGDCMLNEHAPETWWSWTNGVYDPNRETCAVDATSDGVAVYWTGPVSSVNVNAQAFRGNNASLNIQQTVEP